MNDDPAIVRRAAECDDGDMITSAICYAEVAYGSANDKPPASEQLRAFVEEVPVLPFNDHAAQVYASIPFRRGGYDRLIGAHALALGVTLVTDNIKHFADVPGLVVENWTV